MQQAPLKPRKPSRALLVVLFLSLAFFPPVCILLLRRHLFRQLDGLLQGNLRQPSLPPAPTFSTKQADVLDVLGCNTSAGWARLPCTEPSAQFFVDLFH